MRVFNYLRLTETTIIIKNNLGGLEMFGAGYDSPG